MNWTFNPFTNALDAIGNEQQPLVLTLADGPNIVWNAAAGTYFQVTLGGNRVLITPSNMTPGAQYYVAVKQDATGSRTLSYSPIFRFQGTTPPTLTTTPYATDIFLFVYDGTWIYGEVVEIGRAHV